MKPCYLPLVLVLLASAAISAQDTTSKLDKSETAKVEAPTLTTVALTTAPVNKHPFAFEPAAKAKAHSSSTSSDEWHFEVTPYLWAAALKGNLRVRDTTVRVDSSFSDILDMLDFAFATRVEAQKGRWGIHVDENYINLGTTGTLNGPLRTPYEVEPTVNIFEIGPSYTLYAVPGDDSSMPDKFSVEALGGLRWFHLGLGLETTNATREGSRNIIDGFAGGRVKFRPHPKFTLSTKATIGGGGSDSAWTANVLADYQFHRSFSVMGGYQVLDMNADDPGNAVGFDGRLQGIILGLTYHR
jgi:hypothetical protein